MDDKLITVTVKKNTWEALCEASDGYKADSDEIALQEIRYIVEKLVAENRVYGRNKRKNS